MSMLRITAGPLEFTARMKELGRLVLWEGAQDILFEEMGIAAIMPLPTHPMTLAEAMASATPLVSRATERTLRLVRIGSQLVHETKGLTTG